MLGQNSISSSPLSSQPPLVIIPGCPCCDLAPQTPCCPNRLLPLKFFAKLLDPGPPRPANCDNGHCTTLYGAQFQLVYDPMSSFPPLRFTWTGSYSTTPGYPNVPADPSLPFMTLELTCDNEGTVCQPPPCFYVKAAVSCVSPIAGSYVVFNPLGDGSGNCGPVTVICMPFVTTADISSLANCCPQLAVVITE